MKQKNQIVVLAVLVIVAVLVWVAERNGETPAAQTENQLQNYQVLAVENPQIRWRELERAQKTEYKSNGRNPFSVIAPSTPQEIKDRQAQAIASRPAPVITQPPPTEAKLPPNLKFFGYGTVPVGSTRRAFFTDGEDVYIVIEGETLLGRYRILKVGNSNLEFQEISSGLHGTTPLEEQIVTPSA